MTEMMTESLEHLDFDAMCECILGTSANTERKIRVDGHTKCENPADWLLTFVVCCPVKENKSLFMCDRCFQIKIKAEQLCCMHCFKAWNHPMDAYKSITRIR